MNMDNFINHFNSMYPGVMLYQSNKELGDKLSILGNKGKLRNCDVIEQLYEYNEYLIQKYGKELYMEVINDITNYFNSFKCYSETDDETDDDECKMDCD